MDIEKKQIVDKEINKKEKPEENNNNTKILQKNGIQTEIKKEENINNINEKEEIQENITINRNIGLTDEYERSIKVIILGDSSVGKSSLINRLLNNEFKELPATLAIEYHTYLISLNEYRIRMQIWDTAGQEKFNSIVSNYYKGTEVGIFLYSIDNEESFKNVKIWFEKLKSNAGDNSVNVLLGNKKDLENEKRKVTYEQGENFANDNEFLLFRELSCKSSDEDEIENIMEIFDEIGKHFYDFYRNRRHATSSADMNYVATESMIALGEKQRNKEKPKKKKCC